MNHQIKPFETLDVSRRVLGIYWFSYSSKSQWIKYKTDHKNNVYLW